MKTTAPRRQEPIRALTSFASLPPDHVTFRVRDDSADPHLRLGEYAVIDTTDRGPQNGELYLYQSDSGERPRSIVQARIDKMVQSEDEPSEILWTTRELRGFRKADRSELGVPLFTGMCGGHYSPEQMQENLIGRVVGVSAEPLGNLLAPRAGYADEALHNAAFDASEYLDVVIAAGYRPEVMRREDGSFALFEWNPEFRDQAQEPGVFAAMRKRNAASRAEERIKAECIRRGLVC